MKEEIINTIVEWLPFIGSLMLMVFFNAVMDATENENIGESIFKNLNPNFWNKRISSGVAKKIFVFKIGKYTHPGYRLDAWHLSKTLKVFCIPPLCLTSPQASFAEFFIIVGLVWNISFNLFYHGLFKVK